MPKSASDSPSLAPSRKFDRDMQIPPETQVVIDFDDNRAASALVGPYGQNLALIERRLGVVVDSKGNHITIGGTRDGCDAARRVLEALYAQAVKGQDLDQGGSGAVVVEVDDDLGFGWNLHVAVKFAAGSDRRRIRCAFWQGFRLQWRWVIKRARAQRAV